MLFRSIAVLVIDSTVGENEFDKNLISEFEARKIPYLVVWNKCDMQLVDTSPQPSPQGEGVDFHGTVEV